MIQTAVKTSIRVVHPEVDIEPGKPPRVTPEREGKVLPGLGYALLQIENESSKEVTLQISIQKKGLHADLAWVKLAPTSADASNPERDRSQSLADDVQVDDHTITIGMPANEKGHVRYVAAVFDVPRTPAARCGVYEFEFAVTRIGEDSGPPQPYPFRAIVRPFYDWKILPETKDPIRVGNVLRRKRTGLIIENRGNDWLYVQVEAKPQSADQAEVELLARTVLVAPPNREKDSERRSVPFFATNKVRHFCCPKKEIVINLSGFRVDAPSIPPLPADGSGGGSGAALFAPVESKLTTEREIGDAIVLEFWSTFPNHLKLLGEWSGRKGRALLGFLATLTVLFFVLPQLWYGVANKFEIDIEGESGKTLEKRVGDTIGITGQHLRFADVTAIPEGGTPEEFDQKFVEKMLQGNSGKSIDIPVKSGWAGKKVTIEVRRYSPFGARVQLLFLPKESRTFYIEASMAMPSNEASRQVPCTPGKPCTLYGENLLPSGKRGQLILRDSGTVLPTTAWLEKEIEFKLPDAIKGQETVTILAKWGDPKAEVRWTVTATAAPPPATTPILDPTTGKFMDPATGQEVGGGNGEAPDSPSADGDQVSGDAAAAALADQGNGPLDEAARAGYAKLGQGGSDPGVAIAVQALLGGRDLFDKALDNAQSDDARAIVQILKARRLLDSGNLAEAENLLATSDAPQDLYALYYARYLLAGGDVNDAIRQSAKGSLQTAADGGRTVVQNAARELASRHNIALK